MKFWPYVFLKFYKVYMVLKQSVVFPDEFDHEEFIFSLLEVGEFASAHANFETIVWRHE